MYAALVVTAAVLLTAALAVGFGVFDPPEKPR